MAIPAAKRMGIVTHRDRTTRMMNDKLLDISDIQSPYPQPRGGFGAQG
jgi:hypothetical protein